MNGSMDPAPNTNDGGRLVDGRYRLGDVIGVGGMAIVHRAQDLRVDRMVAIKLLRREVLEDRDLAMRFRREALAATVLRHPNIIACLEAGTDLGQPYLVMELIDGEDLAARLRRVGRLSAGEAARVGLDVARALGVAHQRGIVHRDVKPGNIVLARDGRAMITDFGIARLAADAEAAVPGTTLGSVHYFSPEQAIGAVTTPASDVYGLGLVLFEALTGQRAWAGATSAEIAAARVGRPAPSPRSIRPDIPVALEAVVVRALATEPSARFPNGSALATALEPLAAHVESPMSPTIAVPAAASRIDPGIAPVATPWPPGPGSRRRTHSNPRPSAAITGPLAVLGIVAVVVAGALLIAALPGPDGSPGIAQAVSPTPTRSPRSPQPTTDVDQGSAAMSPVPGPTASPSRRPKPRPADVADLCEPFFGFSCGVGAGKVESSVFRPAARFRLGDGWSVASVTPDRLSLTRPEGSLTLASGIDEVHPAGGTRTAPPTARGLVESFIATSGVAAKPPDERKLDTHPGLRVDLTPIGRDRVALFGSGDETFYLEPGGATRVLVADGPTGPFVIAVESSPETTLESILPIAQDVFKTFHFR